MLAERMAKHKVDCWLVNTGWAGGKYGTGSRCPLKYTRRIIDSIHSGELAPELRRARRIALRGSAGSRGRLQRKRGSRYGRLRALAQWGSVAE